jgi:tRNA(Ile2) C34 agmatinyltransferase TiaS
MNQNIMDLVTDEDVKCPKCGGKMKKYFVINGKSKFRCISCGYDL